jgi:hypothetical protein
MMSVSTSSGMLLRQLLFAGPMSGRRTQLVPEPHSKPGSSPRSQRAYGMSPPPEPDRARDDPEALQFGVAGGGGPGLVGTRRRHLHSVLVEPHVLDGRQVEVTRRAHLGLEVDEGAPDQRRSRRVLEPLDAQVRHAHRHPAEVGARHAGLARRLLVLALDRVAHEDHGELEHTRLVGLAEHAERRRRAQFAAKRVGEEVRRERPGDGPEREEGACLRRVGTETLRGIAEDRHPHDPSLDGARGGAADLLFEEEHLAAELEAAVGQREPCAGRRVLHRRAADRADGGADRPCTFEPTEEPRRGELHHARERDRRRAGELEHRGRAEAGRRRVRQRRERHETAQIRRDVCLRHGGLDRAREHGELAAPEARAQPLHLHLLLLRADRAEELQRHRTVDGDVGLGARDPRVLEAGELRDPGHEHEHIGQIRHLPHRLEQVVRHRERPDLARDPVAKELLPRVVHGPHAPRIALGALERERVQRIDQERGRGDRSQHRDVRLERRARLLLLVEQLDDGHFVVEPHRGRRQHRRPLEERLRRDDEVVVLRGEQLWRIRLEDRELGARLGRLGARRPDQHPRAGAVVAFGDLARLQRAVGDRRVAGDRRPLEDGVAHTI